MSNDANEPTTPASKRAGVSKNRRRTPEDVTITTPPRSHGNRRRAGRVFEACEATAFEVRADGSVTFLHAGCASAARSLGVSKRSIREDMTWEVANDNALAPSLRRLLDRASGTADTQRGTVTLAGLDHDVSVVPQGRGRVLCVLRASRFAPGVAHDIHGCLAAVVASAETLLADPGLSAEGHAAACDALEGARRAALLTAQLMTASELGTAGHIDLGSELIQLVPLLRRLLPPGVRLAWEIGSEAPCVRVDPVHLQRVVMNLVANAAQSGASVVTVRAMGAGTEASGGEIDTAVIEVCDDGRGMSPEALGAVEHGGFSSRASGHGLGMANVRDLVRLAGGAVELESTPERGTRVTVTLPGFLPRASGVLGFKPFGAKHGDVATTG